MWPRRLRDESALAEIEAEITAFGETLNAHSFSPGQPGATDAMLAELARALDAYEQAKRDFVDAQTRADALDVSKPVNNRVAGSTSRMYQVSGNRHPVDTALAGAIALFGYDGCLYSIVVLVAWLVALLLVVEPLRNCGRYIMGDALAYPIRQRRSAPLPSSSRSSIF